MFMGGLRGSFLIGEMVLRVAEIPPLNLHAQTPKRPPAAPFSRVRQQLTTQLEVRTRLSGKDELQGCVWGVRQAMVLKTP